MESAIITAAAGELVSRVISFVFNRYCSSYEDGGLEEKLQHLLTRAHTVVEEADARYIRNSGMLMQLKMLSEAMYQGYHALDIHVGNKVSDSSSSVSLSSAARFKRARRTVVASATVRKDNLHAALENLETAVANIAEFVALLCRCEERLSRRPYDAYLYIGSFMFSRHAEKQKLLNFLLQHDDDAPPAPVLPIIGGRSVGKKTLVAHVCADERVRSKFASVLHLSGDNLLNIVDHENALLGMSSLVVVEFVSDVDDTKWNEFYSFVTRTASTGSKVVIISKLARLARFGSVRPIFLDALSYEELWYLFKNLAFGSADPAQHPRLVHIAQGIAKEIHRGGSLALANALADALGSNLDAQLWLSILSRCRKVIQRNLLAYGQNPNLLFEQGREVDLTDFFFSPVTVMDPLRVIPSTSTSSMTCDVPKQVPSVAFREVLLHPSVRPKGEFNLMAWQSRLPPYTSCIHFVRSCTEEMPQGHNLSGSKRQAAPF